MLGGAPSRIDISSAAQSGNLAKDNPEAYLPYVAMTLNNLASLYRATQRMKEAENANGEAETLIEPLWRANPTVHGDLLARILMLRAGGYETEPESPAYDLATVRRALSVSYDPDFKTWIQDLIDDFEKQS